MYLKYGHYLGYTSEPWKEDKIFCDTSISIPHEIVDGCILIYKTKVDDIINSSDYEEQISENKLKDHEFDKQYYLLLKSNHPCDVHMDLCDKEPDDLYHWFYKSNVEPLQVGDIIRIKNSLCELSSDKESVSIDTIELVKKMVMMCYWSWRVV